MELLQLVEMRRKEGMKMADLHLRGLGAGEPGEAHALREGHLGMGD